jgi:Cohesin domain
MLSYRQFTRYVFVLLTLCLMQSPLAHAALIGFQPASVTANTGDSISIDLVISNLGNGSLGSFDISVGFDSSALSFDSYSLGDFLGSVALLEAIDASVGGSSGAVNVAEVSLLSALDLDTLQPGSFVLATLNFNVINLAGGAVTQLSVLSGPVLGNAFGAPIAVTGLGSASIASVPIPGTLVLLLASLLGWLTLNRRLSV